MNAKPTPDTEDNSLDTRYTVWFEDDSGLFTSDSSGGLLESMDERSAVDLFRLWWRGKQRARALARTSIFGEPPTDARH